ncbi:MAG: hypothetical protein A3F72_12340 [Bacteroidetes bacterium RIFCSPLOWO2_12_FULL_35_15]|nr:MAG: hypothetical protein A3F72_12340 [Bacteroidetes bacterium RIFCSPLOWO2_12_FULL_35_15]
MGEASILSVIIPAYNEELALKEFLPAVIEHCHNKHYHLIVVNDGSKDKTAEVLTYLKNSSKGFAIITHKVNKGYGGAIKSGVEASTTKYSITIDADGQHLLEDIDSLLDEAQATDADMVIGNRKGQASASMYRSFGKWIIRKIASILMPLSIYDLNSGMKLYDTGLGKKYIKLCPNNMAYSDIIALIFISQRHKVIEKPIKIQQRLAGKSTISTLTAIDTLREILNIVLLFNPMKIFVPLSILLFLGGVLWGTPIVLAGKGVSVGAMLFIISGLIFFFLGLLAEQISLMRKQNF